MKRLRRRARIRTRWYRVGKGLDRDEALRRAKKRAGRHDWRGFTYDPKTGWASLT